MPKVPQFLNKQLKTIYNPSNPDEPATLKQKNFILTLCERRKIPAPDLTSLTMAKAAQMISSMLNA